MKDLQTIFNDFFDRGYEKYATVYTKEKTEHLFYAQGSLIKVIEDKQGDCSLEQ